MIPVGFTLKTYPYIFSILYFYHKCGKNGIIEKERKKVANIFYSTEMIKAI